MQEFQRVVLVTSPREFAVGELGCEPGSSERIRDMATQRSVSAGSGSLLGNITSLMPAERAKYSP